MSTTHGAALSRWFSLTTGLVAGALLAALAFFVVGLVQDDAAGEVSAVYRLSDDDALEPGPVSLISVRDFRQPSSIPGLPAPTGDHYVSLVMALEGDESEAQQWSTLEDLTLEVFAVDDSGGREQLTPTDSGQLTLDGIGGRIRGIDPYWLRLDFTPPAGDVVEYEVDLAVDGEDHAFTVRAEESA